MEFEVYKSAIESYETYPLYMDWKIPSNNGVQIDGNSGRPYRKSMKGFYLTNKDDLFSDYCIVGDVLTSNKVWGNARERKIQEIDNLLDTFEQIYHCNGNYVPIPEIKGLRSANLAGNNCDTYTHHLNVYREAIEGKIEKYPVWKKWAEEIWLPHCKNADPWETFIKEFYFIDFVEEFIPKSFVVGRKGADQVGIRNQDDDDTVKRTISNTIKLVIQRQYRIIHDIQESFDFDNSKQFKHFRKLFIEYSLKS